jgi:DNA-binding MarR family transcriptional regulator
MDDKPPRARARSAARDLRPARAPSSIASPSRREETLPRAASASVSARESSPPPAVDAAPSTEAADSHGMLVLMMQAWRVIQDEIEAAVSAHGETVVTFRPLAMVVRFGPQTQQDLARLTAQHPAGVSRIVDDLEGRGLVRRVRGAHDRRTIRVEPTAAGRALFNRVDPDAIRALDRALAPLGERDRAAFHRALRKIVGPPRA